MINDSNRHFFFLFGCIGSRLYIAYLPRVLDDAYLRAMAFAMLFIAIGFMSLYIRKSRLTAFEAGGKTWWADLRPFHALMFFSASLLLMNKDRDAYIPLLIDAISGILFYFNKRLP